MTLPELCECHENPENMPTDATPASAASAGVLAATTTTTTATIPAAPATDNQRPSLGEALKAVLQQAAAQGRVTCSLTASVDLLSTRPDDVMLCVMPLLPHPDAAATIQSTLIRAVCLEHNIRVLTVDCDVKLAKTVVCWGPWAEDAPPSFLEARAAGPSGSAQEEVDANCNKVLKAPSACSEDVSPLLTGCDNLAPVMGFPCVLVQYPVEGASEEDELVAEFCKEQFVDHTLQDPYIELPD